MAIDYYAAGAKLEDLLSQTVRTSVPTSSRGESKVWRKSELDTYEVLSVPVIMKEDMPKASMYWMNLLNENKNADATARMTYFMACWIRTKTGTQDWKFAMGDLTTPRKISTTDTIPNFAEAIKGATMKTGVLEKWMAALENPNVMDDAAVVLCAIAGFMFRTAIKDIDTMSSRFASSDESSGFIRRIKKYYDISAAEVPDNFELPITTLRTLANSLQFGSGIVTSLVVRALYSISGDPVADNPLRARNAILSFCFLQSMEYTGIKVIQWIHEIAVDLGKEDEMYELVRQLIRDDNKLSVLKTLRWLNTYALENTSDITAPWAKCIDSGYYQDLDRAHNGPFYALVAAIHITIKSDDQLLKAKSLSSITGLIKLNYPEAIKIVSLFKQASKVPLLPGNEFSFAQQAAQDQSIHGAIMQTTLASLTAPKSVTVTPQYNAPPQTQQQQTPPAPTAGTTNPPALTKFEKLKLRSNPSQAQQ